MQVQAQNCQQLRTHRNMSRSFTELQVQQTAVDCVLLKQE